VQTCPVQKGINHKVGGTMKRINNKDLNSYAAGI